MLEKSYSHRITDIAGKEQDEVLTELLNSIEENIGAAMSKKELRKLFSVVTEIVQNIQNYSIPNKENYFEIGYDQDKNVVINTKNYASDSNAQNLLTIEGDLKGVKESELLEKYNEFLEATDDSFESIGLGLICVKLNTMTHRYKVVKTEEGIHQINLKVLY